jgi:TPR repeat protein
MQPRRHMLVAVAVVFAVAAGMNVAGAPPRGLPSLYELVDAGAIDAPACPCISSPFALPEFRPDSRFHFGAASPAALEWTIPERELLSSADAALFAGYRYRHGIGVRQSDEAAAYWYYESAVRGNNVAMVAVGLMYAAGSVVPQDFEAAAWWWQQALPTTPLASRLLGDASICGFGVRASPERAMAEYRRAAERGDPTGIIRFADMHVNGCGSPDDVIAVTWYRKAADEGYPEAQIALSDLIRSGRGVEMPDAAEAYHWARLAERRVPHDSPLRRRAADAARASARLMPGDAVTAADQMVEAVIANAAKAFR